MAQWMIGETLLSSRKLRRGGGGLSARRDSLRLAEVAGRGACCKRPSARSCSASIERSDRNVRAADPARIPTANSPKKPSAACGVAQKHELAATAQGNSDNGRTMPAAEPRSIADCHLPMRSRNCQRGTTCRHCQNVASLDSGRRAGGGDLLSIGLMPLGPDTVRAADEVPRAGRRRKRPSRARQGGR